MNSAEEKSGVEEKTRAWVASLWPRAKRGIKAVDDVRSRLPFIQRWPLRRWLLFTGLIVTLSFVLWPDMSFVRGDYRLGEIARRDILADRDYVIQDKISTAKRRRAAGAGSLAVFDFDEQAVDRFTIGLEKGFLQLQAFFDAARRQYEKAQAKAAGPGKAPAAFSRGKFVVWVLSRPKMRTKMTALERKFEAFVGARLPRRVREGLRLGGYSTEIQEAITSLVVPDLRIGVVGHMSVLLRERDKGIIVRHIPSRRHERVVKDMRAYVGLAAARTRLDRQFKYLIGRLGRKEAEAVVFLAKRLLKPNLTINRAEIEERRARASRGVKPVFYRVVKGEVIVHKGQPITAADLLKLKAHRRANPYGRAIFVAIGLFVLLVVIFRTLYGVGVGWLHRRALSLTDLTLFVVALLLVAVIARGIDLLAVALPREALGIWAESFRFAAPLACGAILISTLLSMGAAVVFAVAAGLVSAWVMPQPLYYFLYVFLGSVIGAAAAQQARGRFTLIRAGLLVGGINVVVLASQLLIRDSFFHIQAVVALLTAFSGGFLAGVFAIGLVPLLEMLLGYTTDVKLLELASLNRPVMRELMVRAPGTYHHSLIVGTMVEAAAKEIGANPALAKVAAYYHDIGKVNKPLYFIENQTEGINRHEKLAPSMSALILIAHVKEGVELARKANLGEEIIDIIGQHHGTSVIKFFYQKALDKKERDKDEKRSVNIEDFRYPGRRPQTKEAGLVLLADQVEAASKTLVDPTPARVQGLVQKIINTIFSDGQLDECELTLKDLHKIAKSFNQILAGLFHHRIEYPESADKGSQGRRKANGDRGQRPPNGGPAESPADKPEDEDNLKRLGLN